MGETLAWLTCTVDLRNVIVEVIGKWMNVDQIEEDLQCHTQD
jgi:hypothetical protein